MGRAFKPGQEGPESPGDFLARWSRRKIEARDEADQPVDNAADRVLPPEAEAESAEQYQPDRELTDADMPPVESLNADSDYTPFMSPGVSDGLRQKALRKLFSQPACNITDGLNDYDDDYTQFAGLGSIVTHEMKRMLKRELEAERNRLQQTAEGVHESASAEPELPADTAVDPSPVQAPSAGSGKLDQNSDNDAADKG